MAGDSLINNIRKGEAFLANADPKIGTLITVQGPITFSAREDYFYSLCRSIIGQQVSMAAAQAIFNRLKAATNLDPKRVAELSADQLRSIGLSRQKVSYIRDLAEHFIANPEIYNHLRALSDEEVIADLITIKGIGVWSAQMFLIFTLGRLDVFAPDDVGIKRAMTQLYGWKSTPSRQALEDFARSWQPYRSIACWHLWKSLNNAPDN